METPTTSHIARSDYDSVYEPSEDTFLLLDALEKDLSCLEKLEPLICLEIGSGSGIIITALSKNLKTSFCVATDINQHACKISKLTAHHNNSALEVVTTDLAKPFKANLFDIIIFNPPYVPTMQEEEEKRCFEDRSKKNEDLATNGNLFRSWAGGPHGRVVIDKFINDLDRLLTPNGILYLLVIKDNKPDEIISNLSVKGFKAIKFMDRKIRGEHLIILKVTYLCRKL